MKGLKTDIERLAATVLVDEGWTLTTGGEKLNAAVFRRQAGNLAEAIAMQ